MILEIELVPQSSHYNNLRKMLTATQWKKLRSKIIPPLENKCVICKGSSRGRSLDLHEVWEYDRSTGVQKLVRLEGLCASCHECKHFYFTKMRGNEKRARERLQRLNHLSDIQMHEYELKVHREYLLNSSINWTLDVSLIDNIEDL